MNVKKYVEKSGLVRIVLCRWGIAIALLCHLVLFLAEVAELLHKQDGIALMKAVGYGFLLALVAGKATKAYLRRRRISLAQQASQPYDAEGE